MTLELGTGVYAPPANIAFLEADLSPGEPGRVFVNITSEGCGSGCSYCYVTNFRGPQVFLSADDVDDSVEQMLKDPRFQPGPYGTIVSFCPDTEPFKNEQSTRLVLRAARRLLPLGNPVQFSTKEIVPDEVLRVVGAQATGPDQVVFFLSATSVTAADRIEPHAAPIPDRLANIARLRAAGLRSCLYVKPFLPATHKDCDQFIEAVRTHRPDAVVVGILYTAREEPGRLHPVHQGLSSRGIDQRFADFVDRMKATTSTPLFHSASCVTSWLLDREPSPRIRIRFPELCVACRGCEATP